MVSRNLSSISSALLLGIIGLQVIDSRAEITVSKTANGAKIEIQGELFTEYRIHDAPHVYYWPLIGPDGVKMTRSWPMESPPGEKHDHPHHRSLWFAHGNVNGVDFWSEENSSQNAAHQPGKIVHDTFINLSSGAKEGELVTRQRWVAPDGSVPIVSIQRLRVYMPKNRERLFDFEITLKAVEGDVTFGDTKEGSAAIRIAESMRLRTPSGNGLGTIRNDRGLTDQTVWGQPAGWVAMRGPIGKAEYEIVFMEHPDNFRYPTRWHARDYGLFAANPFCATEMDSTMPKGSGAHTIRAGETLVLKYRILLHAGDSSVAPQAYQAYLTSIQKPEAN